MHLSEAKSKHYTKLGLGLALLPETTLQLSSKTLLKRLTKNSAYDQQCEGTRDWYAFQLLLRHPQRAAVISRFIRYFKTCSTDMYWGYSRHLFYVAYRFYRHGWLSKQTLLNRWIDFANSEEGATAKELLLRLGRAGLRLYARFEGGQREEDGKLYDLDFFNQTQLRKMLRLIKRHKLHREISDPDIAAFVRHVKTYQVDKRRPSTRRPTNFKEYLAHIEKGPARGRYPNLFERFTHPQLKQLSDRIDLNTPEDDLTGLLIPFEKRDYPGNISVLLTLLDRQYKVRRVPEAIATILSRTNATYLREVAFTPRPNKWGGSPHYLLSVLTQVFEGTDARRMEELLCFSSCQDDLHSIGCRVLKLCEAGHTELLEGALRYYYYHSGCGNCRKDVVEYMHAAGLLTSLELRQAKFDCYKPIRDFALRSPIME